MGNPTRHRLHGLISGGIAWEDTLEGINFWVLFHAHADLERDFSACGDPTGEPYHQWLHRLYVELCTLLAQGDITPLERLLLEYIKLRLQEQNEGSYGTS